MRIKMIEHQIGPLTDRRPGMEYDVNDAEAVRCINAGIAEMVRPASTTEQKTAPKATTEYRKVSKKGSKRA